jgi:iron complex outermembrane receptor protein
MRSGLLSAGFGLATLASAATARAGDAAGSDAAGSAETIVVLGRVPAEAATDRDRALDDAPFVTIVHPDDYPPAQSVADALGTTTGVQTRSLGGPGAYESVSVRGNVPGQTEVLVDDIPLARLASVTTDLGRFALDGFGLVELYRGDVPIELGGAGVGGAIDMLTLLGPGPDGDLVRASIGTGSFGARHLRARYGDAYAGGRWLSSVTVGYQGATGEFPYFSTGNTPLNPRNWSTQIRTNDGFDQVDGAARIGRADKAVTAGVRVAYKDQQLPGEVSEPATDATMSTLDVIADARAEQGVGGGRLRELGYGVVEDQRLHDPLGQLGLGAQDRAYRTLSAGGQTTWTGAPGAIGVELRGDAFRDADETGMQPAVTGARAGGAVMAAHDLVLAPQLVATLAFRLDAQRTAPAPLTVGPMALVPEPARWDVVPSPRLSVRAPIATDVVLKGSTGWYERLPTLVELFGDRGFLLGTPTLRPEQGPSADAGVVWAPARGLGIADRVLVSVDGFATQPRDTIAFITTGGYVARAANIGNTETEGGELAASARLWRLVDVAFNYTRLATAQMSDDPNLNGKAVPRVPDQLAYGRVEVADRVLGRQASVWADASFQGASYLDPNNLDLVPPRWLVGGGARVELGHRLAVELDVSNLADLREVQVRLSPTVTVPAPITDIAGFPLPGRALYLSLHWSYRP